TCSGNAKFRTSDAQTRTDPRVRIAEQPECWNSSNYLAVLTFLCVWNVGISGTAREVNVVAGVFRPTIHRP
ncbi:MAG TPA: hypothetical protein VFL34_09480, partial [Candidatus Sulfotelmatobacter sp.]|nr:hypothetical protein [Candidatus Sulfotelmatobacter sp.]